MLLLIIGVALWSLAHLFKRLAPARRAAMGEKGKGPVALALLVSLVLMVIGYRMVDWGYLWGRSPALVGINNLLMLFSVYLFAASGMKTWITSKIRHPQLTAVKVWALAHIIVNGDMASFVLFGGLMAWAVVEMIVINRADRPAKATGPFAAKKEVMALVGTLIVFGVIAGAHYLLGYPAFG